MIISASRRTDIAAFYPDWFMRRLRAGLVQVRNPFNPKQIRTVSLRPQDVDALVLWTRNPAPLLPYARELEALRPVWLMTITAMPRALEPAVPKLAQALKLFRRLQKSVGTARVVWRFDPIFITDLSPPEECLARFERLATVLETPRVIVSFADIYAKVPRNIARLKPSWRFYEIDPAQQQALATELARIAAANGIQIQSCCEENLDAIPAGACIDGAWLNRVFDMRLEIKKDRHQRPACRCLPSVDIGAYNTCGHACVYCYATEQTPVNQNRWREQDPDALYLGRS
jgi:hypothetical protein